MNQWTPRLFAFDRCAFCGAAHGKLSCPEESDIVKKFNVVLKQKDGRAFSYVAEAVGFRSAYTDAKRQHDSAEIVDRTPVVRLEAEEVQS